MLEQAKSAQLKRGNKWEKLTSDQQFAAHCSIVYREFQLYLKRLRKEGAAIRYLVVFERHTGGGILHGMPHLHCLIHETALPVRHARLGAQWTMGFTTFKLVEQDSKREGAYVCKYLTKEATNRVKASIGYGRTDVIRGPVT